MIPLAWGSLGFIVFGAISVVAGVGKPRKPITPGAAAFVVTLDIVLAALIVWGGRR